MRLSVLDQSPVPAGFTAADALRNTIDLARVTDRLGYERYWIAEHHAIESLASPAPEILLARIGCETSGIRIGSGAVLLPHYSPMKVAEIFRMLEALYPGRVDLGVGRAPGGTALETYALRRERSGPPSSVDDFPQQLLELMAFLKGEFPARHPFAQIHLTPEAAGIPEIWMLGSSMWSASAAAQLGLPYAFAHFIDQQPTRSALEYYRAHFVPTGERRAPRQIVAIGVVCADTEAEARRLVSSSRLLIRRIRRGERGPVPTPEEAVAALDSTPDPMPPVPSEFPRYIVGDPEQVRERLIEMASRLGLDELMVVTITHDHRARVRSYELLAEALELDPRG
ncbi:MAG TPA: LLM class flavin-dependent oxidoreductase [Candidatus Binataceae bacterium]|nr:LLM class flavin-dependent oxidoreductase [Candidatus Binataceae bacterium]